MCLAKFGSTYKCQHLIALTEDKKQHLLPKLSFSKAVEHEAFIQLKFDPVGVALLPMIGVVATAPLHFQMSR